MIPLLITVDTEADNQWKGDGKIGLKNLQAIPKFQQLCSAYSFVPTYLVTYEVTEDADTVKYLRELWENEKVEIGAHLHPWTTPPFADADKERELMPFPSELADSELRAKFMTLHDAITKAFEKSPKVFRAGRWGYDHRVGKLLSESGYTVDASITPLVDWNRIVKNAQGRVLPNFVHASIRPWNIEGGLWELPMTVLPRGPLFLSRLANYLGRGSFNTAWCRIFPETGVEELMWVYDRACALKLPYCQFMIHSSEFILGSPYTKTDEMLEHHFSVLEAFFRALHERGVEGLSLSDMYKRIAT